MSKLTPKQKAFVDEYLQDFNATRAAKAAGYSPRRASEIGYQLLQKTTVLEVIQATVEQRAADAEINQKTIYRKLGEILSQQASDAPGSCLKYGSQIRALELSSKILGLTDRNRPDNLDIVDDGFLAALGADAAQSWSDYDPDNP